MVHHTRSSKIENRSSRLKLPIRKKPYFVTVAPRIALGYRRNQIAGSWVVRAADGHGANWTKTFAVADDHEEANGETVLTFWAAQDRARALARQGEGGARPITVAGAVDRYEADLRARGADLQNASRVRTNLPAILAGKAVALLGARELRDWRDGLVKAGMRPASADRTGRAMKAALTLAAHDDPRITNSAAWRVGLASLPVAETSRNVILPDDVIRAIIAAAYKIGADFGLFVELAAVTGGRASQLLRLQVGDLQDDGPTPRLMLPSSRKGRRRRIERRPLPIPSSLAAALRQIAGERPSDAPLLVRADGSPWRQLESDQFRYAAATAGIFDRSVTPYALRHSSIVRQIVAGVPTRVVAAHHDTSVAMLERTYSRHIIGDPADAITRRALLDVTASMPADNVIALGRKP